MIDYPEWYMTPQVKFRMINYTYNREVLFMNMNYDLGGSTTRMIRIHNVQGIDTWFKVLRIQQFQREYNMYYSLARYENGIPYSTLDLAKRDFGNWTKDHWKEMVSYDFLLDIDAGCHADIMFAHESAVAVKKMFDRLDVPYYLRFSGRGFHFVIPYEYFKLMFADDCFNPDAVANVYAVFMDIAMKLHSLHSEMIDTKIYDSRRVTKIPYSIALYDGRNYVCTSFGSDKQFYDFDLRNMKPHAVYNDVRSINKWAEHLFNPKGKVNKLLDELMI